MSFAERAPIYRSRVRLCLLAFGVVGCMVLAAAPGAGAAPDWRPSLSVEDSPSAAALSFPKILAQPGGCATAAFERGGTVFASHRPAGGVFAPTQTLGAIAPSEYPEVAAGAGVAAVVWEGTSKARIATAAGCDSFGAAVDVPGSYSLLADPVVAVDSTGRAIAAFEAGGSGSRAIHLSERPSGGTPTTATPIPPPAGTEGFRPRLAANGVGGAALVFDVVSGGNHVYGARRTAPGSWTTPVRLNEAAKPALAGSARVASGSDGSLHAVWIDSSNKEVILATLNPAGAVSRTPSPANSSESTLREPAIAADDAGRLAIVWAEQVASGQARIYGKYREPAGALSPQRNVSSSIAPSKFRLSPAVTIDRHGRTVATWGELVSMGTQETVASTRTPPSSLFAGHEVISNPSQYTSPSGISTDADGNTLVALYVSDTPREARVAAFDAAPPLISGLSIPAAGVVGETLPFSLTALDAWSPPASTQWAFGDGTAGTGDAVSHTYAAAGSFPVQATVADSLGNSSAAAATTTIAPIPQIAPAPQPPAPPVGRPPDHQAPVKLAPSLSRLRLAPKRLSVGSKRCIQVRFLLSGSAKVLWTAERRKRRGWKRTPGSMRRMGAAGANRFCFRGKLGGRTLAPGSYRLRAVATDADGRRSQPRTAAFTLVDPKTGSLLKQ
jgi:hypothetical protein